MRIQAEGGNGLIAALVIPCGAAGPIFLISLLFGEEWGSSSSGLLGFLLFGLPLAFVVGFFLALMPMMIGVGMMWSFGERSTLMRHYAAWGFAGLLLSLVLVAMFAPAQLRFDGALLVTGTFCALLARAFVRWGDLDPLS